MGNNVRQRVFYFENLHCLELPVYLRNVCTFIGSLMWRGAGLSVCLVSLKKKYINITKCLIDHL